MGWLQVAGREVRKGLARQLHVEESRKEPARSVPTVVTLGSLLLWYAVVPHCPGHGEASEAP
jgi:hypothetical protein